MFCLYRITTITLITLASSLALAQSDDTSPNAGESLSEARRLYDALEYDRVIVLAENVLSARESTIEQRLDAYLLKGSALAIVGDAIEAEKPFRFLLRGRPDYDMASDTPPKILAVFRKVQVEERAIVNQMAELERARIKDALQVNIDVDDVMTGGETMPFDVQVKDPRGVVKFVRVMYRKSSSAQFSALALTRDDRGHFVGELPGEWSASDDGFSFEYYITTADEADVPLIAHGDRNAPLKMAVAPGSVNTSEPLYTSYWFWGLVGGAALSVVAIASASAGTVGYIVSRPPTSDLYAHID